MGACIAIFTCSVFRYVYYTHYSEEGCDDANMDFAFALTSGCFHSTQFTDAYSGEYLTGACADSSSDTELTIYFCSDDSCPVDSSSCESSVLAYTDGTTCYSSDGESSVITCDSGAHSTSEHVNAGTYVSVGLITTLVVLLLHVV